MNWSDVVRYINHGSPEPPYRVERSDDDWKQELTPEQFRITRMKYTEHAFSGQYCEVYEAGQYNCICCDEPLFDSTVKFSSDSGWPSFTEPVAEGAIRYEKDASSGIDRVEVLCNVCDAHLGHVFPDGPPPSGLRFCINSESLRLADKAEQ